MSGTRNPEGGSAVLRTLQYFANVVLQSVSEADQEALLMGTAEAVTLTAPVSAIVPTDGQNRRNQRTFRGSFAEYAQARQPRTFQGYAIPKGTVIVPAIGSEGVTVAGNSAFFATPESAYMAEGNDLGVGTSTEIATALSLWMLRHP